MSKKRKRSSTAPHERKLVAEPEFVARAWTPAFEPISSLEEDGNFDKVGGYPSLYPFDLSLDGERKSKSIFVCSEKKCGKPRVFQCQLTDPESGLVYQVFQCVSDDCPQHGDSPFAMRVISYSHTSLVPNSGICSPSSQCYDHKNNLPSSVYYVGTEDRGKFKAFRVAQWVPRLSIVHMDKFEALHNGNPLIDKACEGKDVVVDQDGNSVMFIGESIQFGGRGMWAQTITDGDEDEFRLHLSPSFHLPIAFGDCGTMHFAPHFTSAGDMY